MCIRDSCPWADYCKAHADGVETDYPKKLKKKKLPMRYGLVYVLRSGDDVLLRQRPDKGLLGGMMEFPGTDWGDKLPTALTDAPSPRNWEKCETQVRHVFTHFELYLDVYKAETPDKDIDGVWAPLEKISDYALPTVMTKALKIALANNKT